MTTYTDTQLKQALAKMSGGEIIWYKNPQFSQQTALCYRHNGYQFLDTELLHLCWLVEETLNFTHQNEYVNILCEQVIKQTSWLNYDSIHTTWQQRTIALARVKGVAIV